MTIEDPAHGVSDRVLKVVTLDQHRIDGRNRPPVGGIASSLQQRRERGKHGRCVALRQRRLAGLYTPEDEKARLYDVKVGSPRPAAQKRALKRGTPQ